MTEELLRQIHIAEGKITKLQEEREILRQVGERMMKFADIFKDENAKLKEELNQLLNNPDFAHVKSCNECGDLISKSTGENSTINIKSAKLTWICNDCEQQVAKLKEESKAWEDVVKIHVTKINELQSTLDEIDEYIFSDDFVFPCRDIVRYRIKEILAKHEDRPTLQINDESMYEVLTKLDKLEDKK